ncbi:MAG: hypothetical protein VCD33_14240 [Alphaproteobacteria bacterium]
MAEAVNTRHIAHIDCAGGGQVWVDGTTLYIGHMRYPHGTTVVDVADPANPRVLATIEMPKGWHSHKVRVANDLMIVNHEHQGANGEAEFDGGLAIYDVANPAKPSLITKWTTPGNGVHRYDFDGRYAYILPTAEGYLGNIVMILDLADPARPEEVGRWAAPGQWQAGGETYPGDPVDAPLRCHHPLRLGDRLYVSYWLHGFHILDIADPANPRLVSSGNQGGKRPYPTHTCLPFRDPLGGRDILVVADEDVGQQFSAPPAGLTVFDITDEAAPTAIAEFQVDELAGVDEAMPVMTGCNQPSDRWHGPVVPFGWFAQGRRLIDFSDPFNPRETARFLPDAPSGSERPSSNDVTMDDRGLLYLIDRRHGIDIIETSVF